MTSPARWGDGYPGSPCAMADMKPDKAHEAVVLGHGKRSVAGS